MIPQILDDTHSVTGETASEHHFNQEVVHKFNARAPALVAPSRVVDGTDAVHWEGIAVAKGYNVVRLGTRMHPPSLGVHAGNIYACLLRLIQKGTIKKGSIRRQRVNDDDLTGHQLQGSG